MIVVYLEPLQFLLQLSAELFVALSQFPLLLHLSCLLLDLHLQLIKTKANQFSDKNLVIAYLSNSLQLESTGKDFLALLATLLHLFVKKQF